MKREPNKQPRVPLDQSVIAVIHRAGRTWRCQVGRTSGGKPTVLDSREFPAEQAARIEPWLDMHRAGRVIAVLPAASVICRTTSLPNATPDQLAAALRLQAETHLLGQVPAHRQAIAVVDTAAGETSRSGLILAWPESAKPEVPPLSREMTYAPDVAALAALLDGSRPTDPVLWLDRRDGSMAIALTHAGGVAFRTTREDAADDKTWGQSVTRVVAETAINVNHTGPFVDSHVRSIAMRIASIEGGGAALLMPAELHNAAQARLAGAGSDEPWWSAYGICAGVLLATADQLAPLTALRAAAPIEKPSVIRKLAAALSRPRTAATIAIVCLAILALSPLVMSGMRLAILKARVGDLEAHREAVKEHEARLVMYRDLEQRAWPMTKLLADIASNAPEGVDVNVIVIQRGQEVRISGYTKPDRTSGRDGWENMNLMRERLRQSGVFEEARFSLSDKNAYDGYEFDLFARVARPYRRFLYPREQDFAAWTLRDRLYGEGGEGGQDMVASNGSPDPIEQVERILDEAAGEPDESDPEMHLAEANGGNDRPAGRTRPWRDPGGSSVFGEVGSETDRGSSARALSQEIPPPRTDEQIARMTYDETLEAAAQISTALQIGAIDEETRKRLQREFRSVMNRRRETSPQNRGTP